MPPSWLTGALGPMHRVRQALTGSVVVLDVLASLAVAIVDPLFCVVLDIVTQLFSSSISIISILTIISSAPPPLTGLMSFPC